MSYIGLFGGSTVFQVFTGLWPEKWTLNKVTKLKLKQTTVKWYHFMSFQSLVCMHQYGCNHFLGQKNMLVVLLVVCHIKKKQLWFFYIFFYYFIFFYILQLQSEQTFCSDTSKKDLCDLFAISNIDNNSNWASRLFKYTQV